MERIWRVCMLAIVVGGQTGCGGGIKEGGPPPNTGYVAPEEVHADGSLPKGSPAKPAAPR
jgi:hypothetical protein